MARVQMLLASSGGSAVGEFGRECCWRVRERVLSVGERFVGGAFVGRVCCQRSVLSVECVVSRVYRQWCVVSRVCSEC